MIYSGEVEGSLVGLYELFSCHLKVTKDQVKAQNRWEWLRLSSLILPLTMLFISLQFINYMAHLLCDITYSQLICIKNPITC